MPKDGPDDNKSSMMDTTDGSLMEMESIELFINAIRPGQTKKKYQSRLRTFFDFIPLPKALRSSALATTLDVRLYADAKAVESANAIDALAYTVVSDFV